MALKNSGKTEAGQGGKVGHSNMTHWDHTAEVKHYARKARRLDDSVEVRRQIEDEETA